MYPDSEIAIEQATLIADALVVTSSKEDSHWDESAKNFIEGLILHVCSDEFHSCLSLARHRENTGDRWQHPGACVRNSSGIVCGLMKVINQCA
jgi:hypothetical protein